MQGMTTVSVAQALAGKVAEGGEVTVRGWVRTRRDSKAGLSFVNVSDGSCFAPIQVVAPSALANYEDEVKHLPAELGRASCRERTGTSALRPVGAVTLKKKN